MKRARGSAQEERKAIEARALLAARSLVDRMRALYRELERMTNAPIALLRALVCIGNDPGLPASRLARELGMQRPAVSQVLKALAARGWIERTRDAVDHRMVRIVPTAAGREILQATSGRAVGALQRAVRRLSDAELGKLRSGLEALMVHLPPARASEARREHRASRPRGAATSAA